MKIIVPDTGVLIDGRITELLQHEHEQIKIIVAKSVIAELEYQANTGCETGYTGLEELKKLSDLAKEKSIEIEFAGERPNSDEISRAKFGEIDSKIRDLAEERKAILYTTDKVQAKVAEAEGIAVRYLHPIVGEISLSLEKFFTKETLSVHLKENCLPKAKIGLPGAFELKAIGEKPLKRGEIEQYVKEAIEFSKRHEKSFVEIDREGATVVQVKDYRIVFTKQPFSEATEMTIVRPIIKLALKDYEMSEKMQTRLEGRAEGILIAGPPGSGKSTFATALAEHYAKKGNIVKTLEQPRDLQVSSDITQYGPLEGSFEGTTDILLLVRPDYTIYDEVRKPNDFLIFSELRLAGIGTIGVVHASKPIDAIQRFIGKIDLGLIPQVIDTIIFIERGRIGKVFMLNFTVRPPAGMNEDDLARPVIEVRDLDSATLEYEIYKFGEETVVFPLKGAQERPNREPRVDAKIDQMLHKYLHDRFEYEIRGNTISLKVPEHLMAKVIGKQGKNIIMLEKRLGCRIDVKAL